MGFWDFFKRKKQKIEIEKVPLNELEKWISNKKRKINGQEQNYLKDIKERVLALVFELEQEVLVLKHISVNEKRAEEKIKLIVRENLKNYVGYLEDLIEKLKKIREESNRIIEKINQTLPDFQKRSSISYEKATFLIGKEIGDTKDSIIKFFRDIEQILKENKDIIEKSKIINSVEQETKETSKIKKTIYEISESINENNNKIDELKNKIKEEEKEIENMKNSEKFLEIEKNKEKLEKNKQELKNKIGKLREIIDFKALSNFYHSFEKEMRILKEHKENFRQAFKKTSGEEILSLLRESNLNNTDILNKFQEIEEKEKQIQRIIIEKTEIETIETKIANIKSEIETRGSENLGREKRLRKMKENLNNLTNSIKGKLAKIDVEIVEQN